MEERPSEALLFQELESGRPKPLVFVLNANLLAMVKLVNCKSPPPVSIIRLTCEPFDCDAEVCIRLCVRREQEVLVFDHEGNARHGPG